MRWLLTNPLKTLSPLGLVAVGAVVGAAGVPVVKKTVRSLAVLTVRGVLAVSDAFKETGEGLTRGWEQMVQAAREQQAKTEHQPAGNVMEPVFEVDEPKEIVDLPNNTTNRIKKARNAALKKQSAKDLPDKQEK